MLHFPMLLLVTEAGLGGGGESALFLAATVLTASVAHRFYEFPTRRRLRALVPQRDAEIPAAATMRVGEQ